MKTRVLSIWRFVSATPVFASAGILIPAHGNTIYRSFEFTLMTPENLAQGRVQNGVNPAQEDGGQPFTWGFQFQWLDPEPTADGCNYYVQQGDPSVDVLVTGSLEVNLERSSQSQTLSGYATYSDQTLSGLLKDQTVNILNSTKPFSIPYTLTENNLDVTDTVFWGYNVSGGGFWRLSTRINATISFPNGLTGSVPYDEVVQVCPESLPMGVSFGAIGITLLAARRWAGKEKG